MTTHLANVCHLCGRKVGTAQSLGQHLRKAHPHRRIAQDSSTGSPEARYYNQRAGSSETSREAAADIEHYMISQPTQGLPEQVYAYYEDYKDSSEPLYGSELDSKHNGIKDKLSPDAILLLSH